MNDVWVRPVIGGFNVHFPLTSEYGDSVYRVYVSESLEPGPTEPGVVWYDVPAPPAQFGANMGILAARRYYAAVAIRYASGTEGPLSPVAEANALSRSRLPTDAAWSVLGSAQNVSLGGAVASVGDVDGDTLADFLIADPDYGSVGDAGEGRVELYLSPAPTPPAAVWSFEPDIVNERAGTSITVGDLNGDGHSDLVVGTPVGGNAERGETNVFLWDETNQQWPAVPAIQATLNGFDGAHVGHAVAVGDFNGNGFQDLAASAIDYVDAAEAVAEGAVFVYRNNGGFSPGVLTQSYGLFESMLGARYGSALLVEDLDANGSDDLIVGAPGWSNPQAEEGAVLVYLGANNPPNVVIESGTAGARLGSALALFDSTGDGIGEILVSSPGANGNDGAVELYYWTPGTLALQWTTSGSPASELGSSMAAGDYNGDGYLDLAVGAASAATLDLYYGRPSIEGGLPSTPDQTLQTFGANIRIAGGEFNGDGADDLLVGEPEYTPAGNPSGRVRLFWGDARRSALPRVAGIRGRSGDLVAPELISLTPPETPFSCTVDWGDGSAPVDVSSCSDATLADASHVYLTPGTYNVRLRVTDAYGTAEAVTRAKIE